MSGLNCANCGLEIPHEETKANHCLRVCTERLEKVGKIVGMITL